MIRRFLIVLVGSWLACSSLARGQSDAAEERDRATMARFLGVVEKTPRRGTALDRVYGYHVERGTLDALLKTYQDRVSADPKDGSAWMILGLVESQRGRDAAGVAAFRKAEETRPDDAMPSYYLGQSLVLVGQPDDAARAFERAIARKPNRADLLEIFQALGRVYQRAHRNDQALAVWARLEAIFPDDPRVQEQIAAALAEESQPDQALPRYEALARKTKDRFRQVQFQIDAAELKVRLNRSNEALADFEGLLGKLDPESWLAREVRRKIEEIFTRNDDQAGLANYYDGWIKKTPDDVEAMARLGRALAVQGRMAEARVWFEKAVGLAPSRRDLRTSLIEQLLIERNFPEAASQYQAIAKLDPSNPDAIREWGKVLLRDTSKPEAERKNAAATVWRRLVEAHPDDPSTLVMVADLFRQAEMVDEAVKLYQKAVAISPGSPQYAEYLGEFYHKLKRGPEAIAAWSKMAEAPNRTGKTLGRLAEVLSGFGYKTEALAASSEAATLDRDDFDAQLRHADLLHAADRLPDELAQLDFALKASTSPEQSEAILDRQLKNFQAAGTLTTRSEALKKELDAEPDANSERWRRLARYLDADQKPSEALTAAKKAFAIDPKSVLSLAMIARLDENQGNLGAAADALRKLAEIDRRGRTEYLTGVARLEARLGRKEQALKAGRDLLAAAPGQVENHQFFAELCFQLGQIDEGLDALRRSVRLNEADPKAILGLAETLAQQFRTEEAIEMFWRAFDRTTELEGKLTVINRLTALYLQRGQFDRLISRLERQGREADRHREMTICLAQAHAASGDFGTARGELERLLSSNPRDTKLLFQLSMLAETEGDASTAAKYQKQLVDLAPGDEATARLAQLYVSAGEVAEAEAIWSRLAASGEADSHRVLMAVDSLMTHGKKESVLAITENLLRNQPSNWEALYREGTALVALNRPVDAAARFRSILALEGDPDAIGAVAKARKRNAGGPGAPTVQPTGVSAYAPAKTFPLQDRLTRLPMIQGATGLAARGYGVSAWSPDDFGQARMASIGWLVNLATKAGKLDDLVAGFRQARDRSTGPRAHWDLYYLHLIRTEFAETFDAAKGLARASVADPSAQFAFLNALPIRDRTSQVVYAPSGANGPDNTPPLPPDQMDQALASYKTLRATKPDWIHSAILTALSDELKRAKRVDAIESFYKDAIDAANDVDSAASVLRLAAERGDVDNVLRLLERHDRLKGNKPGQSSNLYAFFGGYYTFSYLPSDSIARAMYIRAEAKSLGDVNRLLDAYLTLDRRPDRMTRRARSIASGIVSQYGTQFQLWAGKAVRFATVTYPMPNPYFDLAAIQVLRNAYEQHKRVDLVSDLKAHVRASIEGSSGVDRAYHHLTLCYLHWWDDEKDDAVRELTNAADASKSDPELLMALAELRSERNEPEEALKVADSFEPLDQRTMQRRELLALRLSVVTGDVDRARKAAERLFGLRLDSDTQIKLAAQMHQLGMPELAEAVLGRARRRSGNNGAGMVALMLQYQRQGKTDVAVQVAHQILRKNPPKLPTPGVYDSGEDLRGQAIRVLAGSGKLAEMITRLETQVARSPGSIQLRQTLGDYYKAAGEKDKARLEFDAMVKAHPDDARLRMQVATELIASGDAQAAVEHYKVAMAKEPSLFGSNFYEIQEAFQTAGKFDDLIGLVEASDIKSIAPIYYTARLVGSLLVDKARKDKGLALFQKLWVAYPGQRITLYFYVRAEEVWRMPEMYEYLRDLAIPGESKRAVAPWDGIEDSARLLNDGRLDCAGSQLVEVAERRGKLESLVDEIDRAEKRLPNWQGGRVLRALALVRLGRVDAARALLEPLADPKRAEAVPADVRLIVGQELDEVPTLKPLAFALYEGASEDDSTKAFNYTNTPIPRLAAAYRRDGRPDDARRVMIRAARSGPAQQNDARINAYYKIYDQSRIAADLDDFGFPADAAKLYDDLLAEPELFELASVYLGTNELETTCKAFDKAMKRLDPPALAASLRAQVADAARAGANGPPIDLLMLIYPREVDRAAVASLTARAIKSEGDDPSIRRDLARIVEARPREIPARIAITLAAFNGPDGDIDPAVRALAKLVEESPLEPLPVGQRANSRQRAEAAGQLGLWLVANECARHPSMAEIGRILAIRAEEAARRQPDPYWLMAMLRESGQRAIDRGDREKAEADWGRMAVPTGLARPTKGVPLWTLDRFEQASKVARLAARNGLLSLSIRAVVNPLRGGPPVVPMSSAPASNGPTNEPSGDRKVAVAVEDRLFELAFVWEEGRVPPVEVYEALLTVVLPDGRPSEVFAYPRPTEGEGMRSVSGLLVRWAMKADRVDDLRSRLESRRKQPSAAAAAIVSTAQLDLARRDLPAVARGLEAIANRMGEDKLQSTAELASLVGLPALDLPDLEGPATTVLERALTTLAASGAEDSAGRLQVALARHRFASGKLEEGRATIRSYLEGLERATAAGQARARNWGGTFPSRRGNFRETAREFARAGRWDDAIDSLGTYADASPPSLRETDDGPGAGWIAVAGHLSSLASRERYDKLAAWTLPDGSRTNLRSIAGFVPADNPPEAFGRFPSFGASGGVVSSVEMLVNSAREAGTLDELSEKTRTLESKKVEGSGPMRVLVEIARGRRREVEGTLRSVLTELSKKPDETPRVIASAPKPAPWFEYFQARAAMADPTLADLGRLIAAKLDPRMTDPVMKAHLRLDVAASLAGSREFDPGLAWWDASASSSSRWASASGHVSRRGGGPVDSPADALIFAVPMTGRFEVSLMTNGQGVEFGYAGTMLAPLGVNPIELASIRTPRPTPPGRVWPVGSIEATARPSPFAVPDGPNRLTIRVEPGRVRYLVNGHLFFEDRDPNPASPWLALGAAGLDEADFRDLTLTGSPEIPREVRLTHGDRLDGWLPDARPMPGEDSAWSSRDRIISSRRIPSTGESVIPNRLSYHRAIRPGESVTYDFRFEPGASMVHPSLGRIAFLIEPEGVRLRWLADGDGIGIKPDNILDEPSSRRGAIGLKPGDWNRLKMSLNGRAVELELNGIKVFERDVEPSNDRLFGLYHDKARTSCQVRDVILRGDWPDHVPADLLALRPGSNRSRIALVGEAALARDAGRVAREARSMPVEGRYEVLAAWVLPGSDHPHFRLAGDFTEAGSTESPALMLISMAVELGKLDDLASRVDRAEATTDLDRRGKLAMTALIRVEQKADASAETAGLKSLLDRLPADAPEADRWPELIALVGSTGRAEFRPLAQALTASLTLEEATKAVGDAFRRQAFRASTRPIQPGLAVDPAWSVVTQSTAKSRAIGDPKPIWVGGPGGSITHVPGSEYDFLFMKVPIRGDFELTGEAIGPRLVQFCYAGLAVGLGSDGKEVVVSAEGRRPKRSVLEPPLILGDGPHRVRMTVRSGTLAVFVDDRKLHEQGLPDSPDPWIALYQSGDESGSIRNLRIEGQPTIPDRLALTERPDLAGWLLDDEAGPTLDLPWISRGGELFGRRARGVEGSDYESVLRYHRPLIEDGEVSYEFFHEPVKALVHPSIGRMALILQADGVRLHTITDGPRDRSGLDPGNIVDEPASRRGDSVPLKPGDWNRAILAIKGDVVSLRINDLLVFERKLDPSNERVFGFFHFADQSEARVRNVSYRGDWPREIPAGLRHPK